MVYSYTSHFIYIIIYIYWFLYTDIFCVAHNLEYENLGEKQMKIVLCKKCGIQRVPRVDVDLMTYYECPNCKHWLLEGVDKIEYTEVEER